MYESLAPFSWNHLNQWKFDVVPTAMLLVAGAIYLWGTRRVDRWPISRTVCFALGLFATFVAVESVVAVYDGTLFSDHMIQHLLLIMIAAPLFALSAPLELARRAGRREIGRLLDSAPMRVVLHPLFGIACYAVFIPATHLTSFFNLMLQHEWIHNVEHIGFIVIGYLLFRPAFGREAGVQLHPGLRLVYVMVAVPVDTFTGLALAMETKNPFPAYAAAHSGTPVSILNDIHLGGAIMWIGGDALMLLALIPIAVTWVHYESRRTRELDAQLDAAGL